MKKVLFLGKGTLDEILEQIRNEIQKNKGE